MKVDYIIVGLGLAGLAFSRVLALQNKSFVIFDNQSQNASIVAGGMYNPVILKRFTPVWDAENQLKIALPFYRKLEEEFQQKLDYKIPVARIFKSAEEQNNWYVASDKPILNKYLKGTILQKTIDGIKAPFGYGIIKSAGRLDTKLLLNSYKSFLNEKGNFYSEDFNYENIQFNPNSVTYKNIEAKYIVFCEGYGVKKNPFFNKLPITGTKGEVLTIKAPKLKIDTIIKGPVFVMPIENDIFKVGATFNWTDKTLKPTQEAKDELVKKLKEIINVPFEIIDQKAGIRPTVKDRRPLIGVHSKHKNLAILNGLGTRGVMLAPKMAIQLYHFLENNISIDNEISITRF